MKSAANVSLGWRCRGYRRAIAAVEVAVVLPLLFILIIGTIESCYVIFLKQSLTVAAYEGARVAIVPGSDEDNVRAQVQQILDQRKVVVDSIAINPADFDQQPAGTLVTVSVESSVKKNGNFVSWFFPLSNVDGSTTMMLEY